MKHPKKNLVKQKPQAVRRVAKICEPPDNNTTMAGYYSRHSRWRPYKRKNRHPRVRLPVDVFIEWQRTIQRLHPKPEIQILEEMIKATELLYANMASDQATIAIHANNIETPLTHAFLLTRVLLTKEGYERQKSMWANVSPEAYFRARNVARFTDMPINVVFSIAIYLAALLSRPTTAGLRAVNHKPFFG